MSPKSVLAAFALVAAIAPAKAGAAEIKLLASVALKSVMESVLPEFERSRGHKVTATFGTAAALKAKIDGGETFDVVVLLPTQIDELAQKGKVAGDSRVHLAKAGAGLGILAGAAKPDISTDEKLKAYLLGVKSLSHSDPSSGGFSTAYFVKMATAMGIADALKAKTVYSKPGEGATLVANGQVEVGVGMMSEVVPVAGVQAIPFRTDDPSSFIVFTGAVAGTSANAEGSRALLAYLRTAAVKDVIRSQGMTAP